MVIAEPVMMNKGVSANKGRLELDDSNRKLTYVKYKEQTSGRVGLFTWIIIKISRAMRSDKKLFDLDLDEIKEVTYKAEKSSFKYSVMTISTPDKKYKIQFQSDAEKAMSAIYEFIK